MRVLVTGANGFIGRVLVQRLLDRGIAGQRVERLVAADLSLKGLSEDPRVKRVEGSIADAGILEAALSEPVDTAFHLASVPGGTAERNPDLGRRVNLDATLRLLDLLRDHGSKPRLVFASTVAVYGDPLPLLVDEDTAPRPAMSYGAHKLAAEVLIDDAARRGWVLGCSLRLPGVVARPGDDAGLISAFMSQLFWALREGKPIKLPVTADGTAWWISVSACVDNLLHASTLDPMAIASRRVVQMPALQLSMMQVTHALAELYGADRLKLVSHEPDPTIQRLFASYPRLLTPRAEGLGFRHDGSASELARRATDDH